MAAIVRADASQARTRRIGCDQAPTLAGPDAVVIVALPDYESLKKTAYLLENRANERPLLTSIKRLESGRGRARTLAKRRSCTNSSVATS